MKPITPLGKYLRKLRIDLDVSLKEMTESIGASYQFASMVENGSKNPPEAYLLKLVSYFGEQHLDEIKSLAYQQMDFVRIDMKSRGVSTRTALAKFVCCIDSLTDDQVEAVLTVMGRRQ